MHPSPFALALNAIAYLTAPSNAQFVTGPILPATPALPHTAVYTTTVARNTSPQAITTVVVTLIVPRDVGYPNNTSSSLITGTAISHFSVAQQNDALPTRSETAELVWSIAENSPSPPDAPSPPQSTLTAGYTDHQNFSLALYGAWAVFYFDFYSTIRETIVEATVAVKDRPTTTDPDRESYTYVRTTTLVQVAASPVSRG